MSGPVPAKGHMPFPHRTVAEWDRRYGPPVKPKIAKAA